MKKGIKENFFWPLILVVIGCILSIWLGGLTQARPQVVFTIAEPIEYSQGSNKSNVPLRVQQLVITNVGAGSAKNIIIKFKKPIGAPEIRKYSEGDVVRTFLKKIPYEIRYPELPSDSSFKIVFLASGGSIETKDIVVKHTDGDAEEATVAAQPKSSQRFASTVTWGLLIFQVFAVLATVKSALSMRRSDQLDDQLAYVVNYEHIKETFAIKKPWYMSKRDWFMKWLQITKQNMRDVPSAYLKTDDLCKSSTYRLLDDERPDAIPAEQWRDAVGTAQGSIERAIEYRLRYSFSIEDALDVCKLKRPRFFPEEKWSLLTAKIDEKTIDLFDKTTRRSVEEAYSVLKQSKPDCLSDSLWQSIQANTKREFKLNVERECRYADQALKKLRSFDLSVLTEKESQSLSDTVTNNYVTDVLRNLRVSKIPISELENLDLQGLTDEQLKVLRESAYSAQKERLLPSFQDPEAIRQFVEGGKPDWLSDVDFAALNTKVQQYDEQQKRFSWLSQSLESEKTETQKARENYRISLRILEKFVLNEKIDDQDSGVFSEEAWVRMKLVEDLWRHKSRLANIVQQDDRQISNQG